jgi:hypothetical protein
MRPASVLAIIVLAGAALPASAAAQGQVDPPGGDDYFDPVTLSNFDDPQPLPTDSDFTADTTKYTVQADMFEPSSGGPPEPHKCGKTVYAKTIWTVFRADRDGQMTIDTAGDFDAVIGFLPFGDPRHDPAPNLDDGVCINDSSSHEEQLRVQVQAKHWYAVQVGGTGKPAGGPVRIQFHFAPAPPALRMAIALVRRSTTAAGTRLSKVVVSRLTKGGKAVGPSPSGAIVKVLCKRGCPSKTFTLKGDAIRIDYLEGRLLRPGTKFLVRVTRSQPRARGPQWTLSVDRHGKLHVSRPTLVGG